MNRMRIHLDIECNNLYIFHTSLLVEDVCDAHNQDKRNFDHSFKLKSNKIIPVDIKVILKCSTHKRKTFKLISDT